MRRIGADGLRLARRQSPNPNSNGYQREITDAQIHHMPGIGEESKGKDKFYY